MNHANYRESMALRLYDELDLAEQAALERHLGECASCRAFADELAHGLGRLAPVQAASDLPADWAARLRERTELEARRASPRRPFWTGVAAGLAAGLMVAWSLVAAARVRDGGATALVASNASDSAAPPASELAGQPVQARAGGELALLGGYLRR